MYVCVCNAVTDSDIRQAVDRGVRSMRQLSRVTGCSDGCGSCKKLAADVLEEALGNKARADNLLPVLQPA